MCDVTKESSQGEERLSTLTQVDAKGLSDKWTSGISLRYAVADAVPFHIAWPRDPPKKSHLGVPRWLSQLSVQFLFSAGVMISGLWAQAPH